MFGSEGTSSLTAVNAEMFLQVMFVLESFSTLTAFELAVCCRFVQQWQLQRGDRKQAVRATDWCVDC